MSSSNKFTDTLSTQLCCLLSAGCLMLSNPGYGDAIPEGCHPSYIPELTALSGPGSAVGIHLVNFRAEGANPQGINGALSSCAFDYFPNNDNIEPLAGQTIPHGTFPFTGGLIDRIDNPSTLAEGFYSLRDPVHDRYIIWVNYLDSYSDQALFGPTWYRIIR